jgi:hypothetical protein
VISGFCAQILDPAYAFSIVTNLPKMLDREAAHERYMEAFNQLDVIGLDSGRKWLGRNWPRSLQISLWPPVIDPKHKSLLFPPFPPPSIIHASIQEDCEGHSSS